MYALWAGYLVPMEKAETGFPVYHVVFLTMALHVALLLFAWSFIRSVSTDPGKVPDTEMWNNDLEGEGFSLTAQQTETLFALQKHHEIHDADFHTLDDLTQEHRDFIRGLPLVETKSELDLLRYCRTCKKNKPDRTHHCRRCDTCRLKMDHHCPWIANCVGFHNQKYFLCMTLYASLATLLYILVLFEPFRDAIMSLIRAEEEAKPHAPLICFAWVLSFAILIPLFAFTSYHIYVRCSIPTSSCRLP